MSTQVAKIAIHATENGFCVSLYGGIEVDGFQTHEQASKFCVDYIMESMERTVQARNKAMRHKHTKKLSSVEREMDEALKEATLKVHDKIVGS